MSERYLLQATTADVRGAIAWHAGQIDALIASPDLARQVAYHVTEIEALNRLVAGDEDVTHLRVADFLDRERTRHEGLVEERARERE